MRFTRSLAQLFHSPEGKARNSSADKSAHTAQITYYMNQVGGFQWSGQYVTHKQGHTTGKKS